MKSLQQTEPVLFSRIYSLGAARGDLIVSNDEVSGPINSSDEWIRQRTGIATRRRASKEQSLMDLSVEAATEAIQKAKIDPALIDAVILATISFPYQTPSGASLLSDLVGAKGAASYDISAACAGYCYGIAQADALCALGWQSTYLLLGQRN
jgi:3-oxoacyl-[acyl-carrier-protein] synthase III